MNKKEISNKPLEVDEKELEESNDILEIEESELSDFDYVAKELYLTLDKTPALTDEEIFEKFPEYENNPEVLKEAKIKSLQFGGDALKKKDENIVSDVSLEESDDSESETPSTSTPEFDAQDYRRGLSAVESSGEVDYSLTSWEDKETGEPVSSAVGPYQFLYNTHSKLLKKEFGVNSKEDFIGNKEAQEGLMDYMLEDKPGRYPFMAKRIEKDYKKQMPKELKYSDLVALEHFVGHGDLRKLFARVRDEKDFNAEDIYEVSPQGMNLTIGEYLKRYRGGYNTKEEVENSDDPTGMENPLDDPNILAAGGDLPPGDYTTGDDDREFTKEENELLKSFDGENDWNLEDINESGGIDSITKIIQSRKPGDYTFEKYGDGGGKGKHHLRLMDKNGEIIYDSNPSAEFAYSFYDGGTHPEVTEGPLSAVEEEYKSLFPNEYKGYKRDSEHYMSAAIGNYEAENPNYQMNKTVGSPKEMFTSLQEKIKSGDNNTLTKFELEYGSRDIDVRVKGKNWLGVSQYSFKPGKGMYPIKKERARETYSPLYLKVADGLKSEHGVHGSGGAPPNGIFINDLNGGKDKLQITLSTIIYI